VETLAPSPRTATTVGPTAQDRITALETELALVKSRLADLEAVIHNNHSPSKEQIN
jgi:hypothetical protein